MPPRGGVRKAPRDAGSPAERACGGRLEPMSEGLKELVVVDPEILGGVPVFRGTRVPVRTLFEYLEADYTLEEFLECFPSVTREIACRILESSREALLSGTHA